MHRFTTITPAAHSVSIIVDDATDTGDPRTSIAASEMVVVSTAFGRVEVTICNGAVVTEVFQQDTGAQVGPSLYTSLADSLGHAVWGG